MAFDSREYQWSDTRVFLLGKELRGLRGLTYKKTVEKEPVYAQGSNPNSIQSGNKKYDGTLMLLKSEFDDLNRAAIAAGFSDITEVPAEKINITCVYDRGDGSPMQTASLFTVGFTEYDDGMKQGDKFKEVTMPFIFTRLKVA